MKALELTKCEADEVIHIGDCPINDVGGARNCNFNTIWFNSEGKKWTEIFPCELQACNSHGKISVHFFPSELNHMVLKLQFLAPPTSFIGQSPI